MFLFKANSTARELQKRVEHMEKVNIELKSRIEETVTLYEQSQRDLRNKQQELMRCNAELEKTRDLKEQLARENKKLGGTNELNSRLNDPNSKFPSLFQLLELASDSKTQINPKPELLIWR